MPVYKFDDVEVDVPNFRVLKSGETVALEPKSLNVLIFLIEKRGRLVEKRELMDAVWGDAFVTENVLTRAVTQLRKALGDDAREARYIETVPTRGYRFIARAEIEADAERAKDPPSGAVPGVQAIPPRDSSRSSFRSVIGAVVVFGAIAVVAIVVSVFRGKSVPQHFQILRETQLTTSDGLTMFPTFAPDARAMAFSADHGDGFEIFVRQLAPGGQEVQITSDGGQNLQPAWSPDGKLIAYYSNSHKGIWLIPAFGGTNQKLTDFGSHPSWSPDGHWIVFQSAELNSYDADSTGVFPPSTIWVIRADGSELRQVTQLGTPEGGHGAPSWSPDGKHIVFVVTQYGRSELWAMAADGTGVVRVRPHGSGLNSFFDPIYSADGNSILYGGVDQDANRGLWRIQISQATSAPIGEPVLIKSSGGSFLKNLSLSNDGTKLVYSDVSLTSSLRSQEVSPSLEVTSGPQIMAKASGCRVTVPAFSPDGSRIAFVSCIFRSGIQQQVWVMNSDGSDPQQLTNGEAGGVTPMWFPDGRHILFRSSGKLFSLDAETRAQKYFADFAGTGTMALSPDGSQLAANPPSGGVLNIWLMDMATKSLKQVTFDKEGLGFPAWSPDGKFLAAELDRGGGTNAVVLSPAGGSMTQLTTRGNNFVSGWLPDGDKILLAKQQEDGIWNVWFVSRSTKMEKQLTHYTKLNEFVRYPAVSPRGNQLVYEYTETTGNIWVLEFK